MAFMVNSFNLNPDSKNFKNEIHWRKWYTRTAFRSLKSKTLLKHELNFLKFMQSS